MLSHSLSFWFGALVPSELDISMESEVQKGCGTNVVVHLQIFQESTEMRSGRITVCLSVQCQGSQARTLTSPYLTLQLRPTSAAASSQTSSYQLQVKLWMGTTWPWAACAQGVGAVPWGWQSGEGGLDGCPGCLAQPSTSMGYHAPASPLEAHEISFILIENTFPEIFWSSKRGVVVSGTVLHSENEPKPMKFTSFFWRQLIFFVVFIYSYFAVNISKNSW